jgi:hypothetical protein
MTQSCSRTFTRTTGVRTGTTLSNWVALSRLGYLLRKRISWEVATLVRPGMSTSLWRWNKRFWIRICLKLGLGWNKLTKAASSTVCRAQLACYGVDDTSYQVTEWNRIQMDISRRRTSGWKGQAFSGLHFLCLTPNYSTSPYEVFWSPSSRSSCQSEKVRYQVKFDGRMTYSLGNHLDKVYPFIVHPIFITVVLFGRGTHDIRQLASQFVRESPACWLKFSRRHASSLSRTLDGLKS